MGTCLVCASEPTFVPALRMLERCAACGFLTYRLPEGKDLAGLYNESYFTDVDYPDYRGQEASLRRSMRRHLRQMSRYAPRRGALLEIGCAYGFFLDEARSHFARVVGVDLAQGPVRHARDNLGLEVRAGDFLALDVEPGSGFDAVCLWDTVEHLPRPDLVLEKARRALSPGGRLFLTTGDSGSLNARLRGARWRHIHPPSHLHYFSRATIRRLLERLGYQVEGIETASYYHTLFNILASIRLKDGAGAALAGAALELLGEKLARRVGLWLNLGDTMFVSASLPGEHHSQTGAPPGPPTTGISSPR